jgi:enamine deaminase RidA (YjgF/YER057c/UK114 family)
MDQAAHRNEKLREDQMRKIVKLEGRPPQVLGSPAVKVADYVFVGGQIPVDPDRGLLAEVQREPATNIPAIAARFQSEYILDRSMEILQAADSSFSCGVRIDQFCTHPRAASPYLEARARRIETEIRPASTHVQIDNLLAPGATCGLQMIALTEAAKAKKEVIVVPGLPASPGPPFKPAPHGTASGNFIFVTGQIAHGFNEAGIAPEARVDPETWYGSPIKRQADVALARCAKVLDYAGASMSDVVRADVYLNDIDDRFELEEVWRKHFPTDPPARTYIPTVRLGAKSCIVEVNVIALKPRSGLKKETITAKSVPLPDVHHPHAVRAGGFLFVSGLCATDFRGGPTPQARVNAAAPWFHSSGKKQTAFILDCMDAICQAGGATLNDVVWTQNFYSRPDDLFPSMEVWNERFPIEPPATLLAGVGRPVLSQGCTIYIDAVAAVDG